MSLFYLYFPPSSHPTFVCFFPAGLSLLIQHFQKVLSVLKFLLSPGLGSWQFEFKSLIIVIVGFQNWVCCLLWAVYVGVQITDGRSLYIGPFCPAMTSYIMFHAPMGRFQLKLIYYFTYFSPCRPIQHFFFPAGLSLLIQHFQQVLWVLKFLPAQSRRQKKLKYPQDLLKMLY